MDETMLCELCEARDQIPNTRRCGSCWELEESFERLTSISPEAAAIWAQHAVYKAVAEIDVGDHTTEDEDIGDLRGKVTRNGEERMIKRYRNHKRNEQELVAAHDGEYFKVSDVVIMIGEFIDKHNGSALTYHVEGRDDYESIETAKANALRLLLSSLVGSEPIGPSDKK